MTMGSMDGAEVCEFVGCYMLKLLQDELGERMSIGICRDDALAKTHATSKGMGDNKKI